jgi:hypothetical protein
MRRRAQKPPLNSAGKNAWCYWCKRQLLATTAISVLAATRDHVIPECRGGTKIVWACFGCNNMKGNMMPHEWLRYMEMNPEWWRWARRPGRAVRL